MPIWFCFEHKSNDEFAFGMKVIMRKHHFHLFFLSNKSKIISIRNIVILYWWNLLTLVPSLNCWWSSIWPTTKYWKYQFCFRCAFLLLFCIQLFLQHLIFSLLCVKMYSYMHLKLNYNFVRRVYEIEILYTYVSTSAPCKAYSTKKNPRQALMPVGTNMGKKFDERATFPLLLHKNSIIIAALSVLKIWNSKIIFNFW